MEDAISMHVINGFEQLIHVILNTIFWEIVALALDCIIHVDVHQLEHEGQTSRWLII